MSKCKTAIYKDSEIVNRLWPYDSYTPNKVYKNEELYVYKNQIGYIHIFTVNKEKIFDQPRFCLVDNLLTKNEKLKEHSREYFDTVNEAIEKLEKFVMKGMINND